VLTTRFQAQQLADSHRQISSDPVDGMPRQGDHPVVDGEHDPADDSEAEANRDSVNNDT
jgi:hypothetical protein